MMADETELVERLRALAERLDHDDGSMGEWADGYAAGQRDAADLIRAALSGEAS